MFWRFAPEPKGLAEEEKRKVSVIRHEIYSG